MEYGRFNVESGGILIGELKLASSKIIISDVTLPQHRDRQQQFHFKRNSTGHQEIMDKLWVESNYEKSYLGEWHTHREPIPNPSFIDRRNWIQIASRKHNSPWIMFLIIGMKDYKIWIVDNGEIYPLTKQY